MSKKNILQIKEGVLKLIEAMAILKEWSGAIDLYYLKPTDKKYLSDLRLTIDEVQDRLRGLL